MRLTLTEKIVLDPGYRRAYTPARDEAVQSPRLAKKKSGDTVRLQARPRRRRGLAEADLVRLLQQSGVGRPSTYAATLEALRRHGYIEAQDGCLVVTERGRRVLKFLEAHYPFLLDPAFSARLEARLDVVAAGREGYRPFLADLWERIHGT